MLARFRSDTLTRPQDAFLNGARAARTLRHPMGAHSLPFLDCPSLIYSLKHPRTLSNLSLSSLQVREVQEENFLCWSLKVGELQLEQQRLPSQHAVGVQHHAILGALHHQSHPAIRKLYHLPLLHATLAVWKGHHERDIGQIPSNTVCDSTARLNA